MECCSHIVYCFKKRRIWHNNDNKNCITKKTYLEAGVSSREQSCSVFSVEFLEFVTMPLTCVLSSGACFEILICVLRCWFVFRKIDLCFGIFFCLSEFSFVFWNLVLCFGILFCVLEYCFVFWNTVLCFGILFCVSEYCSVF